MTPNVNEWVQTSSPVLERLRRSRYDFHEFCIDVDYLITQGRFSLKLRPLAFGLVLFSLLTLGSIISGGVASAYSSQSFTSTSQNTPYTVANTSMWQRIVRMPTISADNGHTHWELTGYTAQQALQMLNDFKPTLLDRYVSGAVDQNALVPVCSGCAQMTVRQFLQKVENISSTHIIARMSLNEYDAGTMFTTSATLLKIQINPPIRILSLDDYGGFAMNHSLTQIAAMITKLRSQGWSLIEMGGCGANTILNGWTNFAGVCDRYPSWAVNPGSISKWKTLPSVKEIMSTMDFPKNIPWLMNGTYKSNQIAAIFANEAANQSKMGYIMCYFVIQGGWDSNKIKVTTGPYAGLTIFQEMMKLINKYDP